MIKKIGGTKFSLKVFINFHKVKFDREIFFSDANIRHDII